MSFKVLHLASFKGNIGDNASHIGLSNILGKCLPKISSIHNLEIRKFYKNYTLDDKLKFDESFVEFANSFDLLIIGGGGFLDFWVEGSETGTTIDISESVFSQIKVPLLISSVGCIPHKQVPDGNIEKFRKFLDLIISKKNAQLALRNDGSFAVIDELFGIQYTSNINFILDNAFFYQTEINKDYFPHDNYMVINVTIDQLSMKNEMVGELDYKHYLHQITAFVYEVIYKTNLQIVFAPHIYSDFKAIDDLLKGINDYHIRDRVSICPFIQGNNGANYIFSVYEKAQFVVGMRLHANICSIALGKKTIGLAALDRVCHLYKSINLYENVVLASQEFSNDLFSKLMNLDDNQMKMIQDTLSLKKKQTVNIYKQMLEKII